MTTIKLCDKCLKRNDDGKTEIFRVGIMKNSPYEYFGFDLCEDCFKDFEKAVNNFLKVIGNERILKKQIEIARLKNE